MLVFYANDFAGEPPFTKATPAVRAALSAQLVAAHRAGGTASPRERTGAAALARRSEAVPRRGARSVESVDRARRRARAEGRSRHCRRDAPRHLQPHAVDELTEYAYQFQRVVDVTTHLTFLRDFLTARGVRLRMAYLPYPGQVSDYYIPFKHRFGGREVTSMSGPQFQVQAAHLGGSGRAPRGALSRPHAADPRARNGGRAPLLGLRSSPSPGGLRVRRRRALRMGGHASGKVSGEVGGEMTEATSSPPCWRAVSPSASAASPRPRLRTFPGPRC